MYKSDFEQECYLNLNIPNIIVHYLLNLGLVSCLLRLKLDATGVFHYLSAYVQCVSCNVWKTSTNFFHAKDIMNEYNEFLTTLYSKASTTFNEFHNIPELGKVVYLINNLQRDDIAFLVEALTKRRNYMYVWTHPPSLFLCFILCYKPWHVSPEWTGWSSPMDLLYVCKLTMSHVTKIKILLAVICYFIPFISDQFDTRAVVYEGQLETVEWI